MGKEDETRKLIKYICENTTGETGTSGGIYIDFYNGNSISKYDILDWCKEYSDITEHIANIKDKIEKMDLNITDELKMISNETQNYLIQSGYAELFDESNDDICSEKNFVLYKAKLIDEQDSNQLSRDEIKNYIIEYIHSALEEPSSVTYWLEKLPMTEEYDNAVHELMTPLAVAIKKQNYEDIQFYVDELTEHYYINQNDYTDFNEEESENNIDDQIL